MTRLPSKAEPLRSLKTGTTLVVIQPSYIPWRGYFHLIQQSDIFVFYDDVQYTKQDWRNRNRIKTKNGTIWITVPVQNVRLHTLIKDVEIKKNSLWNIKHWKTIKQEYQKAPFFKIYESFFQEIYDWQWRRLADLDIFLTKEICQFLGIRHVQFYRSSELPVGGIKTDRLVSLCRWFGVNRYLSGPSARNYIEHEKFITAGIKLDYITYDYPEYPQLHGPFDPYVSIIDLLFNCGPEAPKYIWGENNA